MDYSIALTTLKQADPILGEVIDRIGDCTLGQEPRQGELLDALAESIIYQQLSGKAAAAIHRRFLLLYPELPFLTTDAILNTSDEALRGVGLSRSKVLYIKDLAQRIQLGLPTVAQLEALTDEEIIRLLTQVKGIGRWTAQMLLIFRMHRWDVLPVDDLGIRTAIRNLYRLEDLPDKKTTERIGQAWKPYQTIASWYLWRSLDP
ncbi:MAG: DNA-3-methyladenine glycosylase 2 family protein [Oscillatoriophycideae cyanobacterium NC_groundwater_1537_Pr4_S-0.65um_50_18]|nr:DNA-3-methyladenine glycosylase 2 family protein [Oscillatoriophycideae cyanobacterium NC_groundwater_1537_Pr4_S-0.65um_50_18]